MNETGISRELRDTTYAFLFLKRIRSRISKKNALWKHIRCIYLESFATPVDHLIQNQNHVWVVSTLSLYYKTESLFRQLIANKCVCLSALYSVQNKNNEENPQIYCKKNNISWGTYPWRPCSLCCSSNQNYNSKTMLPVPKGTEDILSIIYQ